MLNIDRFDTMNRKSFLQNSLLGSGAIFLPDVLSAAAPFAPLHDIKHFTNPDEYWKSIRMQFSLKTNPVFLNTGTMGVSPRMVVDRVQEKMAEIDQTGGYGGWESSHKPIADFVGANEDEIALTHNVTEGINIVAWGLRLKAGDEVIVSNHEHVGNALPWLNRARHSGLNIKVLKLKPGADEVLNDVKNLCGPKTRVIALPQIPCTIGQVLPTKEICEFARSRGIITFVDGAHGPGMLSLNLHEMDCDFYATCCHKWLLGPKGTGFLYAKKSAWELCDALWVGGGSDSGWDLLREKPGIDGWANSAHRYYYGSQNAALYDGVVAAIEFYKAIGPETIYNRMKSLAGYLQASLSEMKGRVEVLTPSEERSRGAIVGFKIARLPDEQFQKLATENGFRIRYVAENGLNSNRISTHIYNSKEELDRLIALIEKHA